MIDPRKGVFAIVRFAAAACRDAALEKVGSVLNHCSSGTGAPSPDAQPQTRSLYPQGRSLKVTGHKLKYRPQRPVRRCLFFVSTIGAFPITLLPNFIATPPLTSPTMQLRSTILSRVTRQSGTAKAATEPLFLRPTSRPSSASARKWIGLSLKGTANGAQRQGSRRNIAMFRPHCCKRKAPRLSPTPE